MDETGAMSPSDPSSRDPSSTDPISSDPISSDPTAVDPAALPPEVPFEGHDVGDAELDGDRVGEDDESLTDRTRHTGVGVEDPNIVGDVGPTDIPPGGDPDNAGSDVPWVEPDPT